MGIGVVANRGDLRVGAGDGCLLRLRLRLRGAAPATPRCAPWPVVVVAGAGVVVLRMAGAVSERITLLKIGPGDCGGEGRRGPEGGGAGGVAVGASSDS